MRAPRGIAPGLHEIPHPARLKPPRHRPFLAVGNRARRHRLPGLPVVDIVGAFQRAIAFPGTVGARLAAGMAELDAGDRILLLDELDQTAQRRDELVIPDTEIAERAATATFHLG